MKKQKTLTIWELINLTFAMAGLITLIGWEDFRKRFTVKNRLVGK